MQSTVFCLASGLDTFLSHLVQQEDSTYSPGTSKLLCQNFSSGKEEMSKSEWNWTVLVMLFGYKRVFLAEMKILQKIS